jgi:VWFA-related protein
LTAATFPTSNRQIGGFLVPLSCGFIRLAVFAAFVASAPLIVAGQAAVLPAPAATAASPASGSGRITIDVEVTDKSGQPIEGLGAGDFTLFDNDQPKPFDRFNAIEARGANAGAVHVVLVVDSINTAFDTVAREREQLGEFFKQNGGELANPVSVAILSERGLKAEPGSTRDGKAILDALDKTDSELRVVGRSAGIYGAAERLEQSLGQLSQLAAFEAGQPGRKLFVFISPGWPMLSTAGIQEDTKQRTWVFNSLVQLTNGLREANVALYTIDPFTLGRRNPFYYQSYLKGVSKVSQAEYPYLALQVLAEHTGGLVFIAGSGIVEGINRVLKDAGAYYTLSFDPAPPAQNTEYHALRVKMGKQGLIVRTTAGYYVKGISTAEAPAR